jgi:rod shape-determining protein MreB and related proteins
VSALAIDLGTSGTLIHVAGRGVVVDQPSLVARRGADVIAVGAAALAMEGRNRPDIAIVRPLHDGVVADLDACVAMLQAMLRLVPGGVRAGRVLISVPRGVTAVERAAFRDAAARATGARRVALLDEPMAAAIGEGLPVSAPRGHMILDVGSGITEAAVTCLGEIVACSSLRAGGETLDARIEGHLRAAHGLAVGPRTAERLKRELLAGAAPGAVALAKGRDVESGLPRARVVTADELGAATGGIVASLVEPVLAVLEALSPELVADVGDRGIWITGGGSLVPSVATAVARRVGVPARRGADPLAAVIRGNAAVLTRTAA